MKLHEFCCFKGFLGKFRETRLIFRVFKGKCESFGVFKGKKRETIRDFLGKSKKLKS